MRVGRGRSPAAATALTAVGVITKGVAGWAATGVVAGGEDEGSVLPGLSARGFNGVEEDILTHIFTHYSRGL